MDGGGGAGGKWKGRGWMRGWEVEGQRMDGGGGAGGKWKDRGWMEGLEQVESGRVEDG